MRKFRYFASFSTCLAVFATFITAALLGPATGTNKAEAGSALIGGQRITCGKGSFAWRDNVPGVGLSIIGSGIIMDNRLKGMHRDFQRFVFLHECAHQNRIVSESGADCWAIKRGVYRGYFTSRSVERICRALWNTPMGIAHNAGPDRCRQMQQCFVTVRGKRGRSRRARSRRRTQ